jgi:hypothetical protein
VTARRRWSVREKMSVCSAFVAFAAWLSLYSLLSTSAFCRFSFFLCLCFPFYLRILSHRAGMPTSLRFADAREPNNPMFPEYRIGGGLFASFAEAQVQGFISDL